MANIHELLSILGQWIGIPTLKLNQNGEVSLDFDQQFTVVFERGTSEEEIFIYGILGRLPRDTEKSQWICAKLLEGNLFGNLTEQAVLALDATTDEIVLWKKFFPEKESVDSFRQLFETFVSASDKWSRKVQEGFDEPTHTDTGGFPALDFRA